MNFSKKDTLAMKGIAIIMMIFHHCFLEGRYEGYDINFMPFSEGFTLKMASFFKICVAIYVFLTGYGITIKMKKNWNQENISRKEIIKKTVNRYISLMAEFWFIFIISQVFCWFMNKGQLTVYKSTSKYNSIIYLIADGLGLANLYGTPTLNSTWWYMSLAIALVAFIPILIQLYKKYGFIVISVILFFLTQAFKIDNLNMTRWLFTALLGIVCADKNILARLKEYKVIKNKKVLNKMIKFIIGTIILGILAFLRENTNYTFLEFRDGLIPVFVIYYCYEFIIPVKCVNTILMFLGKHSTNIFLTHTFIRLYYFKDFTYSFKNTWLIVFVLLGISLILSIVIETFKKCIKYNKLVEFVKNKINKKIDNEPKYKEILRLNP